MLKYWRMRRKGLDMKSWRRFKLPYVIKCWERDEGEIMTLLGWEWRKCWVGRAFAEGETLESVGCEKVEGKGERDVRSVAYGYELSFLECTLQGWSRESNTFYLAGSEEWSNMCWTVCLWFFRGKRWVASLGIVELEVAEETQGEVFPKNWKYRFRSLERRRG